MTEDQKEFQFKQEEKMESEQTTPMPDKQAMPATKQAEQSPADQLNNYINNELRFAEETIIRALRTCVSNVTNTVIQAQNQKQ